MKNNLKRFLAIFMIGAVIMAFSACGQDTEKDAAKDAETKTASEKKQDTDKKEEKTKEEKKKDKEKTTKKSSEKKEEKKETSPDSKPSSGGNSSNSNSSSGNSSGSNSGNGQTSKEKGLSTIMSSILAGVDLPKVGNTTLSGDNFPAFAFIEKQDGYTGLASEALVGSIAHSVVLVRVPEGASAKSTAASIKANADPRKWICVEAEKTIVKYHKRTVLLIMSDAATANAIAANFDALY
ncbi:prolipoprotein diacylglyceryl transferase [uncultured Eubacterium sp.]|nr:prolipoprotein diacylglyceryl transferase [uncultured Eubacterium sp.]